MTLKLNRKNEMVLNRLRIGHTNLTHGFLMTKEDAKTCNKCGTRRSVKHILKECLK